MRTRLTSTDDIQAPATVAELKDHARIEHNESDGDLGTLLTAVAERIEDTTRVAMLEREFVQTMWDVRRTRIELSRAPVVSVASVKDGTDTLVDGDDYELVGDELHLASAPDDALTVTYTAGLATENAKVPASLRAALLRYATAAYETPGSYITGTIITDVPPTVKSALIEYMRVRA